MEIECIKPLGLALILGLALCMLWIFVAIGSSVWCWVWAWIDDAEAPKENRLMAFIMIKRGYTRRDSECYPWEKDRSLSDGSGAFYIPLVALTVAPSFIVVAFLLYPVTIGAFTLYLLARLARFARRHKKLFDKHIADPDAHKN